MLYFTRPGTLLLGIVLVALAACRVDAGQDPGAPPGLPADSVEADSLIPLPGGKLGVPTDSLTSRGISEPYLDSGVCPFECCTYTEWIAREPLTVYTSERDTTTVAFTIPAGERFTGITGNVHLDRLGLVAMRDTHTTFSNTGPLRLGPGDTLYVLSHIGEGHFNVLYRGERISVEGFWADNTAYGQPPPPGVLIREPQSQWWAKIRNRQGRTGWLFMDRLGGNIGGIDACGGPEQ